MERVQPNPRQSKVRKRLVEADGCFLAEEVDSFTTCNSKRFFHERAAYAATSEPDADGEVRKECLNLPITEQLRKPNDFALDHSDDSCDAWCGEDPQRSGRVVWQ